MPKTKAPPKNFKIGEHEAYHSPADDRWHVWLPTGRVHPRTKEPVRKHVKRRDPDKLRAVAEEHLELLKGGIKPEPGRPNTLAGSYVRWLDTQIKPPRRAYKTWTGYRSLAKQWIYPHLGAHVLRGDGDVLTPEHVDELYVVMADAGLTNSYIRQAHQNLSTWAKWAFKRGHASRNVMVLVDAPTVRKRKPRPLGEQVARQVVSEVLRRPDALRWLLALIGGIRPAETLGLEIENVEWGPVELELDGELVVTELPVALRTARQVQRRTATHGCPDPVACVAALARCRTGPCRPAYVHGCRNGFEPCPERRPDWRCPQRQETSCRRHLRDECPEPCLPGCVEHARWCPQRVGGGLVLVDLKSEDSERTIPLDPVMGQLAAVQIAAQQALAGLAREEQRTLPYPGLLFTAEDGGLINPEVDRKAWRELLVAAGVAKAALYAARHTAATFLLEICGDLRAVRDLLGHSTVTVTEGYAAASTKTTRAAIGGLAKSWLS